MCQGGLYEVDPAFSLHCCAVCVLLSECRVPARRSSACGCNVNRFCLGFLLFNYADSACSAVAGGGKVPGRDLDAMSNRKRPCRVNRRCRSVRRTALAEPNRVGQCAKWLDTSSRCISGLRNARWSEGSTGRTEEQSTGQQTDTFARGQSQSAAQLKGRTRQV